MRATLAEANERHRIQEARSNAELEEARRQLAAAAERADAADRRVALELDRERSARAKAERQSESLLKSVGAMRDQRSIAEEATRRLQEESRAREAKLQVQLAKATEQLAVEKQRLADMRSASHASEQEASVLRGQVANLQASLDRLTELVQASDRNSRPRRRSTIERPM